MSGPHAPHERASLHEQANTFAMPAPELQVSEWLNADHALTLAGLRGRVVVVHAFQMLCPGCVAHALPQAKAIREAFPESKLAVIGLHSVFEHHDAMAPIALKAFLHEYRIRHPVGIDRATPGNPIPLTMQAYAMQGTPTLLLFDRQGRLRLDHFGHLDDLRVGAVLGQLLGEADADRDASRHCHDDEVRSGASAGARAAADGGRRA